MANASFSAPGVAPGPGGGSGSGMLGTTAYSTVDPAAAPGGGTYSSLLTNLQNKLPGAPPSYQDLLTQGTQSPLLQTVLAPAMQNLRSQFDLQNQQFNDEFRSAGALGSGAQAVGMGRLAQAQGNSMGNLIAQIVSQMLPQMTQGLNQQYQNQLAVPGLLGSILGTAKPQVVEGKFPNTNLSANTFGGASDPFMDWGGSTDSIFNQAVAATHGGSLGGGGGGGAGGYNMEPGLEGVNIDPSAPFDYAAYDSLFNSPSSTPAPFQPTPLTDVTSQYANVDPGFYAQSM